MMICPRPRHFRRLPITELWASSSTSLGTRVGRSERAMVAERPELTFRHREPIVIENCRTIRRQKINSSFTSDTRIGAKTTIFSGFFLLRARDEQDSPQDCSGEEQVFAGFRPALVAALGLRPLLSLRLRGGIEGNFALLGGLDDLLSRLLADLLGALDGLRADVEQFGRATFTSSRSGRSGAPSAPARRPSRAPRPAWRRCAGLPLPWLGSDQVFGRRP
jgi:hypothetical protein